MSQFTETMYFNARCSMNGMVTGEPHEPVRHTWAEVHQRARHVAGGLASAGVGHGDAVAVLAGAPVEIAPTAQGIWMRGASLTMLHQPTPRTDLARWAEETTGVIKMIDAAAVIVSDPFMAAAPLLSELGMRVLIIEDLLEGRPISPVHTDEIGVAERADGRRAVLLAPAPEVAAGETAEDRRAARLAALALQGEEDLLHRVAHGAISGRPV